MLARKTNRLLRKIGMLPTIRLPTPDAKSAPAQDDAVSLPAQDDAVSLPVQDDVVSLPAQDDAVSLPVQDDVVPVPAQDDVVTVPVQDDVVSLPAEDDATSVPAPVQMSADGRYVISADLKDKLHARGIDTSPPPGGRLLPPDSVFEPPCSIQWIGIFGRISMGSFSYGVSGEFNNVTIGRYVSIAEDVQMGKGDHSIAWLSSSPHFYLNQTIFNVGRDFRDADAYHAYRPDIAGADPFVQGSTITIGNDVWIGYRAYIRPGVTIGTGAIIGACAVVSRDVPPYAVVVGNPGRVVRYRFDDALIARLLASRWWTLAPWQLEGIDVSRPAQSIDAIERRVAESQPYAPDLVRLTDLV